MPLNEAWHSRLPQCRNAFEGIFFAGKMGEEYWVVAWWSKPVARAYNGKGYMELRRMAIRDGAPKNTASRFLGWMARRIKKTTECTRLISYQDTEVHTGTIYKASGWSVGGRSTVGTLGWKTRGSNRQNQSKADKIRWEYQLKPMNDYWNDPPKYPEVPECCDQEMTVDDKGNCRCAACGKTIERQPDPEPPETPEFNWENAV